MHIHHNMDEYVVVLSGSLRCRLGNRDVDLETGDAAFMPRGLEHAFTNLHAEPCDCFWVFNPGGFHPFLAALDEAGTFDPQVVGPIAARHGHELTGRRSRYCSGSDTNAAAGPSPLSPPDNDSSGV